MDFTLQNDSTHTALTGQRGIGHKESRQVRSASSFSVALIFVLLLTNPVAAYENHDEIVVNAGNTFWVNGDFTNFAPIRNYGGVNVAGSLYNLSSIQNWGGVISILDSGWLVNERSIESWSEISVYSGGYLTNLSSAYLGGRGPLSIGGTVENYGYMNVAGPVVHAGGELLNRLGGYVEAVGSGSNYGLVLNEGTLFIPIGTFDNYSTMVNSVSGVLRGPSSAFRNFGDLYNAGTITNNLTVNNSGVMRNAGSIEANVSVTTNAGATFTNLAGGTIGTSGTSGGQYTNWGMVENFGAWLNAGTSRIVNNAGATFTNAAGALLNNENPTSQVYSGSSISNWGAFNNYGTLQNSSLVQNYSGGSLINQAGGVLQNSGRIRIAGGSLSNEFGRSGCFPGCPGGGTIKNSVGATILIDADGALVNRAMPAVGIEEGYIENDGVIENNGTIENGGLFVISATGTVTGSGAYLQSSSSARTVVSGVLSAGLIDIDAGVLGGRGTLIGDVNIGPDAILAPGQSPGTLTIDGDLHLNGGVLEIEIAGFEDGAFDRLIVTGQTIFDAVQISVSFLDDAFLQALTSSESHGFQLVSAAGGVSGWESTTLAVYGLSSLYSYDFGWDGGGFSLNVTTAPVPLPHSALLLLSGLLGLSARVRARRWSMST